jgi:GNAT superfamily N-acetyltransferase
MALVIRETVRRDYKALCELIDQVDELHRNRLSDRFKAVEGPVRTRDFVLNAIHASDVGLFVAEMGKSLAGFVHVVIRDTPQIPIFVERRYAIIDSLAVRQEHRRSGIGRALMDEAETWAKAKGASSIELNVYASTNPRSLSIAGSDMIPLACV